ncbi:hypothetical protein PCANC_14723 [Puccinia coronata f. sp. avenae]|uniref:Extracellular membrane protein CFEM domain-containing protein n=1 Tax=Puccinia coronata f. sp. avenae TaxID=200324 RepID=A0A2N5SXU4_9BASI|nr:hypothetical protein PCANC_14723 [Puccinia coronata f. sp. avenae]PLW43493.1 hypothetical protein PCASD_06743 [Puccinia coronata f. sp. avenae]
MHFFKTTIIAIAAICSISLSVTAQSIVHCEQDRSICACTSPAPPAPGRPNRWHGGSPFYDTPSSPPQFWALADPIPPCVSSSFSIYPIYSQQVQPSRRPQLLPLWRARKRDPMLQRGFPRGSLGL